MSTTKTEPKTEESEESKAIELNSRSIDRTIEAYSKEWVSEETSHQILIPKSFLEKFKSKFKKEIGPLQIIISTMNRRQILTYDEKTGKPIKKDYLTYNVDFHGKDRLGNDLPPVGHIEGKSLKPKIRINIEKNWETGDGIEKEVYEGTKDDYFIELTDKNRKQVIEDIINKCNGSTIENIKFYGHFPDTVHGPQFRCNLDGYT